MKAVLVELYRPFRRYSFLAVSAAIGLAVLGWRWDRGLGVADALAISAVGLGLWGVRQLLRPSEPGAGSAEEVLGLIGRGRPAFVNFYSDL